MNPEDTQYQLQQLFKVCDKQGKGYIKEGDLVDLCINLGISKDDARTIFLDLDFDNDGKIGFYEFARGFKEFLHPEGQFLDDRSRRRASMWSISSELHNRSSKMSLDVESEMDEMEEADWLKQKKREHVYQAWTSLTSTLVDTNLLSLSTESKRHIRQLHKELQCKTLPPNVASQVECAFSTIMKDMEELQQEKKTLQQLYQKEKDTHEKTLKSLEYEMEDQVAKMEERAKQQAKLETEEEKRQLQEQMDQEVSQMQTHLKILQKVDNWLSKDQGGDHDRAHDVRKKLDEAYHANRDLKTNLHEASSNVALLRSDLAHSRLQYDEKCKELHEEREQILEYIHQYEQMRRQVDLLHEANRRLQDTNDSLREQVNFSSHPASRTSSRASSLYNRRRILPVTAAPANAPVSDASSNVNYGIVRLMEDLDSGLSTLPDKTDAENDGTECQPDCLTEEGLSSLSESKSPPGESTEGATSPEDNMRKRSSSQAESGVVEPSLIRVESMSSPIDYIGRETSPSVHASSPAPEPPPVQVEIPDRTYKVVMAGDAAVGKSTYIVRVCKGIFVDDMASTLGVDFKVKSMKLDDKNVVVQLWDTAGQERFRSVSRSYFRRADGVLLLYDVTSERSFLNVREWIQCIKDSCEDSLIPMMLCGNKTDLREDFIRWGGTPVSPEDGEALARECSAKFLEISTKSGENVMEALIMLTRNMMLMETLAIKSSKFKLTYKKQNNFCCGTQKEP